MFDLLQPYIKKINKFSYFFEKGPGSIRLRSCGLPVRVNRKEQKIYFTDILISTGLAAVTGLFSDWRCTVSFKPTIRANPNIRSLKMIVSIMPHKACLLKVVLLTQWMVFTNPALNDTYHDFLGFWFLLGLQLGLMPLKSQQNLMAVL